MTNQKLILIALAILVLAACAPQPEPAKSTTVPAYATSMVTLTPAPTRTPSINELTELPAVASARADLVSRRWGGAGVETVTAENHVWTDSCLGLGASGEKCYPGQFPGKEILLSAAGKYYVYRVSDDGVVTRMSSQIQVGIPEQNGEAPLFTRRVENADGSVCSELKVFLGGAYELANCAMPWILPQAGVAESARVNSMAFFRSQFATIQITEESGYITTLEGNGETEAPQEARTELVQFAQEIEAEAMALNAAKSGEFDAAQAVFEYMTFLNQGNYEAAARMLSDGAVLSLKSDGETPEKSLEVLCASQKLACSLPVAIIDRGPADAGGRRFWVELEGSTPSKIHLTEINVVKNGEEWVVETLPPFKVR